MITLVTQKLLNQRLCTAAEVLKIIKKLVIHLWLEVKTLRFQLFISMQMLSMIRGCLKAKEFLMDIQTQYAMWSLILMPV